MNDQVFDVGVIGGGPAGATTARLLAESGKHVFVVERTIGEKFRGGESLPPQANPLLERLGLLEHLASGPHLPCYGNQSVWGSDETIDTDFIFSPHGSGWHVDREVFDRHLLSRAKCSDVTVFQPAQVLSFTIDDHIWQVDIQCNGQSQRKVAKYLVDASGQNRVLLRNLNIKTHRYDRLVARIATLANPPDEPESDSRSIIESVSNGWWYSGLLPQQKRVVMFFCDVDDAIRKEMRSYAGLMDALSETKVIGQHITARHTLIGQLLTRSAASTRPEHVAGSTWLAVGDAAASLDPLSSRGLQSGLESAERASAALSSALQGNGDDLCDYADYQRTSYDNYLTERQQVYRSEQRWNGHPFWAKRSN